MPSLAALISAYIPAVPALKAANLLIANPVCLPNSSISVLAAPRSLVTLGKFGGAIGGMVGIPRIAAANAFTALVTSLTLVLVLARVVLSLVSLVFSPVTALEAPAAIFTLTFALTVPSCRLILATTVLMLAGPLRLI